MANLLPNPKMQFFDTDGSFLVGGKIYTYEPGTTTPKATYTTAAATVTNANPVLLDSRGEATIFWNGNYKVTVKDANDSLIYTVDNVAPGSTQVENYLTVTGTNTIAATSTIGLTGYTAGQVFTFTPANTNTAATTINVNSLGAKNLFWNGVACSGGELRQGIPVEVMYDGTQFQLIGNAFAAPFLDTYPVVRGSADGTKQVRFEVDGLTTATTRVLTVPNASGTIVLAGTLNPTRQVFTSGTGTYTPPAGCVYFVVEGWGGGGGGGGGDGSNRGTGGGGGGYFQKKYSAPFSASYSYNVAAAAAAVGQGSGGTAGNPTIFDTCTANGGAAGLAANGSAQGGVAGGTATGGDVNIQGGGSTDCGNSGSGTGTVSFGGDSPRGGFGGKQNVSNAGQVPGGGASNNNITGTGAAGARGEIVITEYYI